MCPSIKEIYALFKMSIKKICNIHVQNEGGGVKGRLNYVKKTAVLVNVGFRKCSSTL